jgi:general secretion pathway protein K
MSPGSNRPNSPVDIRAPEIMAHRLLPPIQGKGKGPLPGEPETAGGRPPHSKRLEPPPLWPGSGLNDEKGTVLLLVILVLALISVLILTWAQEWRTELKLTANSQGMHQNRRLAEAGVFYAIGKLATAQVAETATSGMETAFHELVGAPGDLWRGDQQPHSLELPEGKAEISVANESGKINLNTAPGTVLRSLFLVLGVTEPTISIMVDSIEDWRSREVQPHPFGAKSDYYLRLDPPYVAKNGKFEVVEELAWVRGFEANPLLPRLGNWLTVLETGKAVNINSAPLEVLMSLGVPPEKAQTMIAARQTMPFSSFPDFAQFAGNPLIGRDLQISFRESKFYTITSTGQSKNYGGRYTVKATIQLDLTRANLWEIISWFDGFPSN